MRSRSGTLLIISILLIVFGIALTFFLIKAQYDDCADRWNNNLDGFGRKYDSVQACFWERSTGIIILSVILGAIPFFTGCYLLLR